MKKTAIYTMLCSTVMFSGALLAADGMDAIRAEFDKKREEIMERAPKTPHKDISSKYPDNDYSPWSKQILIDRDITKFRMKRKQNLTKEFDKIHKEEVRKKYELEAEQEKQKRQEEQLKQEALLKQYAAVVVEEKTAAHQKEEENQTLVKSIEKLNREVKELTDKYEKAQNLRKVTVKDLAEDLKKMSQELEEKTTELSEATQKLRAAEAQVRISQLKIETVEKNKEDLEKGIQSIVRGRKGGSTERNNGLLEVNISGEVSE